MRKKRTMAAMAGREAMAAMAAMAEMAAMKRRKKGSPICKNMCSVNYAINPRVQIKALASVTMKANAGTYRH